MSFDFSRSRPPLSDRSKLMSADIFRQRGGGRGSSLRKKFGTFFCPSKVAQCVLSLSRSDILISEGRGGGGVKRSEKIEISADINFERSVRGRPEIT